MSCPVKVRVSGSTEAAKMILVEYLEILRSLSTPSRFAGYASRWFKKSLSLDFGSIRFLEVYYGAGKSLESMELQSDRKCIRGREDGECQYKLLLL